MILQVALQLHNYIQVINILSQKPYSDALTKKTYAAESELSYTTAKQTRQF